MKHKPHNIFLILLSIFLLFLLITYIIFYYNWFKEVKNVNNSLENNLSKNLKFPARDSYNKENNE